MVQLTDNEKWYLQMAYNKGFRWVATNQDEETAFFREKPIRFRGTWEDSVNEYDCTYVCFLHFGTSWEDQEPTRIVDLLGIDEVDWKQVKPFTPVWVRDNEGDDWERALFITRTSDPRSPFRTTYYARWTDDGTWEDWVYCRLATKEELEEVEKCTDYQR